MRGFALLFLLTVPAEAGFFAAAGKVDITPDPAAGNVYLAGYGAFGKKAVGVRDPLYARVLIVSDGTSTVALVSVDLIGFYRNDVLDLRRRVKVPVFLTATHTHSGPDTLGMWGRFLGFSGVDDVYQERVKTAIASLIGDLLKTLEPAELSAASEIVNTGDWLYDRRDPEIIDSELNTLSVRDARGKTIATGIRFSCHATLYGRDRDRISADYPGRWCDEVEKKNGGTCLFFPGSIGGHTVPKPGILEFPLPEIKGPLDAIKPGPVRFSHRDVFIPIENPLFLALLPRLAFGHDLFESDQTPLASWKHWWLPLRHLVAFPLPEAARPWVWTEVSLVELGALKILGIPGESFPEQAIGGYAGASIGSDNPNPPKLVDAPKGPYLRARLAAKHAWIVNLANDEIGYTIPSYDFQITQARLMKPRPQGTHYGETNSIGKRSTDLIMDAARELIAR
ncbi:MAG: hypothetical protein COB53_06565 [Elusimicrobia bacterium]|nr:MAG: hypothetical protein COB53_06565 [Elusimicrobiota bacterium]